MDGGITQYLWFPLVVAVVTYVFQAVQVRHSIRRAITIEINRVVAVSKRNLDYASRSDHYWLAEGGRLQTFPVPFPPHDQAFTALLPQLHLIGGKNFSKVLAFYAYYRSCENLRTELFRSVQRRCESDQPISAEDVEQWNRERQRLENAYRVITRGYEQQVSIAQLRLEYDDA